EWGGESEQGRHGAHRNRSKRCPKKPPALDGNSTRAVRPTRHWPGDGSRATRTVTVGLLRFIGTAARFASPPVRSPVIDTTCPYRLVTSPDSRYSALLPTATSGKRFWGKVARMKV